jgi:hypothetical protein
MALTSPVADLAASSEQVACLDEAVHGAGPDALPVVLEEAVVQVAHRDAGAREPVVLRLHLVEFKFLPLGVAELPRLVADAQVALPRPDLVNSFALIDPDGEQHIVVTATVDARDLGDGHPGRRDGEVDRRLPEGVDLPRVPTAPFDLAVVQADDDRPALGVREGGQGRAQVLGQGTDALAIEPLVLGQRQQGRPDLGGGAAACSEQW